MNVSIFIGSLIGGGAERVTCNLANYLIRNGHNVNVIVMSQTSTSYPLSEKVQIFPLLYLNENRSSFSRFFLRIKRFKTILRQNDADVYIVMLPITIILFLLYSNLTKAKVIITERNTPLSYSKLLQYALRRLTPKADLCICQTKNIQEWYNSIPNGCKTKIIPNAINPNFVKPLYTGEKRKTIVNVGRLNDQKNQKLLIQAFSKIANEFSDYDLEIYGKGELENALRNLVVSLNIENRVHFRGYVENIGEMIKDVSLFVLSSDYEGMPNALIEAMALGLPCISTDCEGGGAKFLIENNKNGILVEKNNERQLVNAIRFMLSNREKAINCGIEAYRIIEKLSPERIYKMWYESIIDTVKRNGKEYSCK